MKISCLVPTRGRVVGMTEFAETIFNTANNSNDVEIIFYIDNDDLPSKECADKLKERYNIKYLFENRVPLSKAINDCHKLSEGDIFFCGSDDIIMLTKGWDDIIIDAFNKVEDKICLIYGLDGFHRDKLVATHPFLHRRWLEVLGYVTPQYFGTGNNKQTWCNNQFSVVTDKWINAITEKIQRRFFVPVFHQHVSYRHNKTQEFTKRKHDKTTHDLSLLYHDKENNPKRLYDSLGQERKNDINKLKDAIHKFQLYKLLHFAEKTKKEYPVEAQQKYFNK